MSCVFWYPVPVHFYQFGHGIEEHVLIDSRYAHPLIGPVHPFQVLFGPEYINAAVSNVKGFKPFKYSLCIMQRAHGGFELYLTIGFDPWVNPFPVLVVHAEHVV